MNSNKSKGFRAESIASSYLEKQGYKILDRNYHTKYGEIDIVCKDNNILVFVEVKYRKHNSLIPIEESVSENKVKRILKTAEIYIERNEISFSEMRLDVIFITNNEKDISLKHLKGFY